MISKVLQRVGRSRKEEYLEISVDEVFHAPFLPAAREHFDRSFLYAARTAMALSGTEFTRTDCAPHPPLPNPQSILVAEGNAEKQQMRWG
ncbi:hypothetical protein N2601_31340 (plasmid) [Rhizobium sp. CB3060]|uniref:hypothetical protein n=1 Tax=Rhizobium sp. CB3060 TaxID=3138255 RepID=UPI0021A41E6E|nr:hypothetical protein [Rhizobium tropici]UWU25478.1 hypothetical protein N2601_31340 [Rhizobium tropici]